MTRAEVQALATFNTERSRGLVHTPTYAAYMADLQEQFYAELKANPGQPVIAAPAPRRRWWQR